MTEEKDGPLTTEARVLLGRLRSFSFTLGKEGKMQSEAYTDCAAAVMGKVVDQLVHHDRITAVKDVEADTHTGIYGTTTVIGDVELYEPPDGSQSCPYGHTNVRKNPDNDYGMLCLECNTAYALR